MAVYERKNSPGTFRVVVWANGKPHEKTVHGGRPLALAEEAMMRDRFGAKSREATPAQIAEQDASEIIWIGGAPAYVYFIQEGRDGPIKIGVSRQAGLRLRELQIGSAHKLHLLCVVPGGRLLERTIHKAFDRQRLDGEWFRPSKDLLALVAELLSVSKRSGESIGAQEAESPPPRAARGGSR